MRTVEPADLEALAIIDPGAFTAARNERAKQLRAEKERDRATAVTKLRKPTWTAWALNVLAREHPDEVADWLAAGDALDAALTRALSGDREELREAQQAERAALGTAVDRASAIIAAADRTASDQDRQRLTGTLRAAITDPEVRDQLVRGVLLDDVEAPAFGFGFGGDADVVSLDSARSRSAKGRSASTGASARAGTTTGAKAGKGSTGATRSKAATGTADDDAHAALAAERAEQEAEARAAETRRLAEEERAAELAQLEAEVERRQTELEQLREAADAAEAAARDARAAADAADQALAEARAAVAELPPLDLD